jgi:transmembrane sensor
MSEPVHRGGPPASMSADDAAALWMVKRDQGVALEHDAGFAAWLAASPDHASSWARLNAAWDEFDAGDDPLLEATRRDALSARRPSMGGAQWGLVAAACAVLVLAGAGFALRALAPTPAAGRPQQLVAANAAPTFATAVGAASTFTLSDGSQVTLDTNSAVAVAYDGRRRAVRLLRGQAFFSVVHDPARPFTVDIGARTVEDLGTDFDARLDGASLSITLVKGSLAVTAPDGGRPSTLTPGQRLQASPGQGDRITTADLDQTLAWRTGYLEFHDALLSQAFAEMNRYGGAPAHLIDGSLRDVRVSGRFKVGDPTAFARALAELYPLRLARRPGGGVDVTHR